ncbi:hypothetical protein [Gimesia maris]|mgnify:FL=1|uniref:Branched-chain amino acid aminotransferase n=2 Tax=Gimesia maris TaxID=122 RepID=A0ABX5YQY0_9PLAN|nr:hypothetical protein [Gimesia maris]QDU16031.1 hypothetical protein CA11_38590 [Gimesia maris]QEG18058.1 hypothetical protein GmarT_39430 [Gimesia maris]QGQ28922.1 hypothetical protein F1729_09840 [Gimesia maris]HAW30629.1 hypothetical protein [Planctomycetaceae bacterium]|tara:strand:+ start:105 stop:434 length:330 start_codon:yes stop_codon:yes gene_type:complete
MLNQLWNDEAGFVISAELVLVLTIAVLAMIVGLSEVAVAVNTELNDISNAIGSLNQSYAYTGFAGTGGKNKSHYAGSMFNDAADDCDLNTTCDLVTGTTSVTASESVTP